MTDEHEPTGVLFLDTETTGLHPELHPVWEVAAITDSDESYLWHIRGVSLTYADPKALSMNGFYDRYGKDPKARLLTKGQFIDEFLELADGRHLAGAVVSFDEERIRRMTYEAGLAPTWHYHLVDVEALAAGLLGIPPPWDSEDLSRKLDVLPDRFSRHTAMGDAKWAKSIYEKVFS